MSNTKKNFTEFGKVSPPGIMWSQTGYLMSPEWDCAFDSNVFQGNAL